MNLTEKKADWRVLAQKYSMFLVLCGLFIVCSLLNPNFLSVGNLSNISRQLAVPTILAFGQTILIISGMLDLSQGAVLALAGVLSVSTYQSTESLVLAFLVAIVVAVVCNIASAAMVTIFDAPPFIITIAMQAVARGAALDYTKGQNLLKLGKYTVFGQESLFGIPIPILFLVVIFVITAYVLRHTKMGRSLYAVGGNEEASIASGINVRNIKLKAFIFNGVLVGIASVLFMSRVNSGLPNGGIGFETQALTAAIIGGTSFSGGIGSAGGTIIGAFIVGFMDNIMNLIPEITSYQQQMIRGAIIAFAVILDIVAKKRRARTTLIKD